ncbi:unnamed protein product [Vitrella brassicaformis CCMP3155]|uniref:EML-like second beta-propeller domain-containing protein n=3 Tax=Vitrella brassicaformis TaxID=1169539 RepID=A0A0G4FV67_VITBC|nr:unnamed protein product [Vitrella brassicaformis CCMP3155]|eukprot:CEM18806.1 unnamed protein product [Vitrella brassicaformis CCMP3155]
MYPLREIPAAGQALAGAEKDDGSIRVQLGRRITLLHPPTQWQPDPEGAKAPNTLLELQWAYGYNGSLLKSLHWINSHEYVYATAALCVVQNIPLNVQRFFSGHDEDVTCVTYNVARGLCASGQRDPKGPGGPYVCVWSPGEDLIDVAIAELHFHQREVTAVCFSADGKYIYSFGRDDHHLLAVWRTPSLAERPIPKYGGPSQPLKPLRVTTPIYSVGTGKAPTFGAMTAFRAGGTAMGTIDTEKRPEGEFVGFSKEFVRFWVHRAEGQGLGVGRHILTNNLAVYGKHPTPRRMVDVASVSLSTERKSWLTAENGYLYSFIGNTCKLAVNIAKRTHGKTPPLGGVCELPLGGFLAADFAGVLYSRSCLASPLAVFTPDQWAGDAARWFQKPPVLRIASLASNHRFDAQLTQKMKAGERERERESISLLVAAGTTTNHLFVLSLTLERDYRGERVVVPMASTTSTIREDVKRLASATWKPSLLYAFQAGHMGEVWGLAHHPSLQLAVTGGGTTVRFWDVAKGRPLFGQVLRVEHPVGSLSFAPSGHFLAAGLDGGMLRVWAFPKLEPVYNNFVDSRYRERVYFVQWSDKGDYLAACCGDQRIYLFTAKADSSTYFKLALHRVLVGNSSSILCCMFSKDGKYLISNSKDAQILCWATLTGHRETRMGALRNLTYQLPWVNIFGWPVIGLWGDPLYDCSDIDSCCSDHSGKLIVMGDDYGRIKLFRFPTPYLSPDCRVYGGHSAHVTRVLFTKDNKVFSTGGRDATLLQWRVVELKPPPLPQASWESPDHHPPPAAGEQVPPASAPRVPSSGTRHVLQDALHPHRQPQPQPYTQTEPPPQRQQQMEREEKAEGKGLSFVHPPYATAPAPGVGMASLSPAGPLEGPSGPVVATARGRAKLQQYFKDHCADCGKVKVALQQSETRETRPGWYYRNASTGVGPAMSGFKASWQQFARDT